MRWCLYFLLCIIITFSGIFFIAVQPQIFFTIASVSAPKTYTPATETQAVSVLRHLIFSQDVNEQIYTLRERQHLSDLHRLVQTGLLIDAVLTTALLGWLAINLLSNRLNRLQQLLVPGGTFIIILSAGMLLLAMFDFENFFVWLHRVLFHSNSWQLDPLTESLIRIFPPEAFYAIGAFIFIANMISGGLMIILGLLCQTEAAPPNTSKS